MYWETAALKKFPGSRQGQISQTEGLVGKWKFLIYRGVVYFERAKCKQSQANSVSVCITCHERREGCTHLCWTCHSLMPDIRICWKFLHIFLGHVTRAHHCWTCHSVWTAARCAAGAITQMIKVGKEQCSPNTRKCSNMWNVQNQCQVPGTNMLTVRYQCQVPGTCYQVLGTRYLVPVGTSIWHHTRYLALGTLYQVPVTGYQLPGTWCQVPGFTWYQLLGTRHQNQPADAPRTKHRRVQTVFITNPSDYGDRLHLHPLRPNSLISCACILPQQPLINTMPSRESCVRRPKSGRCWWTILHFFVCTYIYIYIHIYIYIYIYICLRVRGPTPLPPGKGHGPRLPPVGVGGLVCGGWYDCSDTSELHLLPNRTEQLKISDSCRLTWSIWWTWWTWQISMQISMCFINIPTEDILQGKCSFSKPSTGVKSPLFRAATEQNDCEARNPYWNHGFQ
jgi:hypothetical protein